MRKQTSGRACGACGACGGAGGRITSSGDQSDESKEGNKELHFVELLNFRFCSFVYLNLDIIFNLDLDLY